MEAIDLNNSEGDQAEDLLLPKATAQPNNVQQNVTEEEVIDITMQSDVLIIFNHYFIIYR